MKRNSAGYLKVLLTYPSGMCRHTEVERMEDTISFVKHWAVREPHCFGVERTVCSNLVDCFHLLRILYVVLFRPTITTGHPTDIKPINDLYLYANDVPDPWLWRLVRQD